MWLRSRSVCAAGVFGLAADEQLVTLAERDERIAGAEVVDTRPRIDQRRLEEVVGGDAVELAENESLGGRIGAERGLGVDRHAHPERVAVGVLQARGWLS